MSGSGANAGKVFWVEWTVDEVYGWAYSGRWDDVEIALRNRFPIHQPSRFLRCPRSDYVSHSKITLLDVAVEAGNLPAVKLALRYGANPNYAEAGHDSHNYTSLHRVQNLPASCVSRMEILKALLAAGANVNAQSTWPRQSVLQYAMASMNSLNNSWVIPVLLKHPHLELGLADEKLALEVKLPAVAAAIRDEVCRG